MSKTTTKTGLTRRTVIAGATVGRERQHGVPQGHHLAQELAAEVHQRWGEPRDQGHPHAAAAIPSRPPFGVCAWTMPGRKRRIRETSCASAPKSCSGEIARFIATA